MAPRRACARRRGRSDEGFGRLRILSVRSLLQMHEAREGPQPIERDHFDHHPDEGEHVAKTRAFPGRLRRYPARLGRGAPLNHRRLAGREDQATVGSAAPPAGHRRYQGLRSLYPSRSIRAGAGEDQVVVAASRSSMTTSWPHWAANMVGAHRHNRSDARMRRFSKSPRQATCGTREPSTAPGGAWLPEGQMSPGSSWRPPPIS